MIFGFAVHHIWCYCFYCLFARRIHYLQVCSAPLTSDTAPLSCIPLLPGCNPLFPLAPGWHCANSHWNWDLNYLQLFGAHPSIVSLLLLAHLHFGLVCAYLSSWPFKLVPKTDGPSSSEAQQKKFKGEELKMLYFGVFPSHPRPSFSV